MASLQELLDQKSAIEREIVKTRQDGRAQAIAQVLAIMRENELTIEDLAKAKQGGKTLSKDVRKSVAPKYRDQVTGSTWTGRGLKPRWLRCSDGGGQVAFGLCHLAPGAERMRRSGLRMPGLKA